MAHEDRPGRRAVDREAQLSGGLSRRLRLAAASIPLVIAGCATGSPQALRLEDRSGENVVRIVNPDSRPVNFYIGKTSGFSGVEFHGFHVRYRDREGRPVVFEFDRIDHWWTPLIYVSEMYPLGREPYRRLRFGAGTSRDVSRADLFAWFQMWRGQHPPVAGPCTAQLRLFGKAHPRATDYVEIEGDWQPAPCPIPHAPPPPLR